MANAPKKVRDPNKPKKKGRKTLEEINPRQRMMFVSIRIAEVSAELEKLKAERKALREKMGAQRAAKKSAGSAEADD
jgi:hypothetical protein